MFLRKKRKVVRGESYEYWHLCESVRTGQGPRQRVVASLFKLDDKEVCSGGWEDIGELLSGKKIKRERQLELLDQKEDLPKEVSPQWEKVNVREVRVERTRDFGEAYLALALWRRLELDKLLKELIVDGHEKVDWPTVASILVTARFCQEESELGVAESWYEKTALEDILGVKKELINDDRLYRGLDKLGEKKEKLCSHLIERYKDWFGVRMEFLLYDVTSTFFEGQAEKNEKAARGYSRDNRSDCKQVCIGLVCTPEGLPLSYEVFSGNRADVTTVKEIVTMMEEKYGMAERIWVMDRGMVSEANVDFLRSRKASYIIGTPKSELSHFQQSLLEKENWCEVQEGLEAKLLEHPDGNGIEKYLLCRSSQRAEKEKSMLIRQSEKLSEELQKIHLWLERSPQKDKEKVGRRIGRWTGKYPAAAKVIEAKVQYHKEDSQDAEEKAIGLQFYTLLETGQKTIKNKGAYLLRTNCSETDPAAIWKWYIQLVAAEAAFRTAKSDLGLRPIYHQKTSRVEAHILVCFLALALWRSLEQWMVLKDLGTCARKLIASVATIKSMDVILPIERAGQHFELRLRTVAKPDKEVAQLLLRLGLQLPRQSKIIENVVPKMN
jgi:transposase